MPACVVPGGRAPIMVAKSGSIAPSTNARSSVRQVTDGGVAEVAHDCQRYSTSGSDSGGGLTPERAITNPFFS
jgi:hypothetical protein